MFRLDEPKHVKDNYKKCSVYTWLWSNQQTDLCKRAMLQQAFYGVGVKDQI